ncbi:MAG: hypothetical protein WC399_02195 [Bacilli bacterium]|jgi:hypothetical protein
MSKRKAIFNFIGLFLFISAIVVLNESIVITEAHLQLQLSKYYFAGGALLLFLAFIFMWVFAKHKELVNWKAFLLIVLAFAAPIVAVFLHPGTITFTATAGDGISQSVSLTLGLFARFQSLFFALSSALVVYLLIIVIPKLIKTKTILMVFLYVLVIALVALIGYSVVVEWDQYYLLFSTGDIDYYSPTISLFSNTNVFGYYLSLGIFALGILDSLKHRFWHYGLMLVFTISLLLTITITSYIGAFTFLIAFIVYDLVTQFKKHPVSASIWTVSLGTILFAVIIGFMLSDLALARSIREDFIPESVESLQARLMIWRHAREMIFEGNLFVGNGLAIANALLQVAIGVEGGANPTNRFHNGWYDVMASGGIVGLAFYLIGLGFIVYLVVKRYKYNHRIALTVLFILIGILIQSVAEAKVFFKADAMGTLGTLLVTVPLLIEPKLIDERPTITRLPRMFSLDPPAK